MRALRNRLRRFGREDRGGALMIEFVIFIPVLIGCFLMSVEMGIYSMRQMFLERGLDMTVRYVRLHTNTPMTHGQLKDMICTYSGFLQDCDQTLRLEMISVDPRNFAAFDQEVDCVDLSQPVTPVRGFTLGRDHEMMMLRACVKFDPVFPTTGLGRALEKDGSGKARMVATAAFVQEPS